MRQILLLGILLLVGCQSTVVGPLGRASCPQRADCPGLSIGEQERRGRSYLAFPDTSPATGPGKISELAGPDSH